MSGSRLGRGRGGRLAVYGACGVGVLLLVFLYRAATTEMSRLRDLHVQCVHQQEALAAQLQVIFEYKVQLEKSLAEEKSSNAAVKQELQQRASREKSLRDKDSVEALRRFNSLQQTHKILESENQDLKEECEKQQKQALEDRKRLESTLRELRAQIRDAKDDKEKSMEHLKTKFLEIDTAKTRLEERYNALFKTSADTNSTIEHLRKEVIQLNRELEENVCNKPSSERTSMAVSQGPVQQLAQPLINSGQAQVASLDEQQGARPFSQQQISPNVVTSSSKPVVGPKVETSTKSGVNAASTISSKSVNPVVAGAAAAKPAVKAKLPIGVLPILDIIDTNAKPEETKGNAEEDNEEKNPIGKNIANEDGKDKNSAGNNAPGHRFLGEQILNGPDDAEWFRAKGIQEIGDDLGNDAKLQDFEDGQNRAGVDGADYDNQYPNKGPQQIHPEESEDEGEEEDVADYMNNNEMKKQE